LTGLHGLHVTAGVAAMVLLFVRAARASREHDVATWAGGVSLFWHLVDLIWLFVFATIWLLQ
jgi:heme/copper-type cytochrome/quinol oxidase subunit 3